ncbi:hypothetical protein CW705_04175 [Candidatus Bathyarchaeota archaeon]|nr:MAG: hypothetical protein CW705_04175 [Candidatus Bathyarchaeota archaeon]
MTSIKKLSFIVIMTSLCISTNYLMIGIPNVKFMDLFVFLSGYTMGSLSGALVGVLTWLVYGTINPYGFNLPTLIATCIGESLYGVFGGFSERLGLKASSESFNANDGRFWREKLLFGIIGFLLTFIYDLFTNVVTAMVFGIPLLACIAAGIPFTLVHEVSNFLLFFLLGNLLANTIQKMLVMGGEKFG